MTHWCRPERSDCRRRRPFTDSDYGSKFAVDAFRAIIGDIQTIRLDLNVAGQFVGAGFIVANA